MQEIVAIYRRVSTLRQVEDGVSLDAQKERLEKLCEVNNYKIYKDYVDEGLSGKDTEHRPAFNEMMEDMRKGLFSKIIVLKIDRISRNIIDLENTINEMQKYKCDFESASEKIDTHSSMGMMFIRLLGIFAQFERERISERVKDAFAYKIENGEAITGSLPIGFKIREDDKGIKRVVIDEEKKEFIIDIFKKYEETSSMMKTVNYLNTTYPTFVYNGGFSTTDLKRIMQNTMYYGSFKNNENYCEAYFSKEYWQKINDIRENKNIKGGQKNVYLFSGLIIGSCGHKFYGATYNTLRKGKNYHYGYRCGRKAHFGECKNNFIVESIIEQEILKNLSKWLKIRLKEVKTQLITQKDNEDIDKKVNNLKAKKKKITNSYIEGWISHQEAKEEIKKIDELIKENETVLENRTERIDLLENLLTMEWLDIYKSLLREQKRDFYRTFIKVIYVDLDKYKTRDNFITLEFI